MQTSFLIPLAVFLIFVTAWTARNPQAARERVAGLQRRVRVSVVIASVQEGWRLYMPNAWTRGISGQGSAPQTVTSTGRDGTGAPPQISGDGPIELENLAAGRAITPASGTVSQEHHDGCLGVRNRSRSRTPTSSPCATPQHHSVQLPAAAADVGSGLLAPPMPAARGGNVCAIVRNTIIPPSARTAVSR